MFCANKEEISKVDEKLYLSFSKHALLTALTHQEHVTVANAAARVADDERPSVSETARNTLASATRHR